jgi:hypothetical protein
VAEYIKLRMTAAKAGVTLALMGLIAGIAERAQASPQRAGSASVASFLKLHGLSSAISGNFLKIEKKLLKLDTAIASIDDKWVKLENTLSKTFYNAHKIDTTFLKITDASAQFLKIADANAKFLKLTDTAADSNKLGGVPATGFFQGSGNVVSGALSSLGQSPQQLLSLPGGIIIVTIANPPGAGPILTIHNGTANTLAGAVAMGDGSVSQALTLKPNGDTLLPAVQNPAAEIRLQIFPGGSFTNVVSILIGLTPNPSTNQPEVVAQAFTGGV